MRALRRIARRTEEIERMNFLPSIAKHAHLQADACGGVPRRVERPALRDATRD